MKTIVWWFALFAAAGVCLTADPVEGCWLSVDEKTGKITAGWEIYQVENKLLGVILSMPDYAPDVLAERCKESYAGFPIAGKVNQMKVIGTPWVFGLSMEKAGLWSGGNVINPEDGKMYRCKIIYHAADGRKYQTDTLEMRGEIGLGIGRSQFWKKAGRTQAASLYNN